MAHRRTPQADSDLDDIWYYIASKSGSLDVADRFIDSITDRFFLLASYPNIGRARRGFATRLAKLSGRRVRHHLPHSDEDVLILRVLRGSRNIEALFRH